MVLLKPTVAMELFPPIAIVVTAFVLLLGLLFGLYAWLTKTRRRLMRKIRADAAAWGWRYGLLQYFVNSLGRDGLSCADLMSYLLFDAKYTRALIEIGYNDADKRIDEIENFLFSSDDRDAAILREARLGAAPRERGGL